MKTDRKAELQRLADQLMKLESSDGADVSAKQQIVAEINKAQGSGGEGDGPASEEQTVEHIQSLLKSEGALTLGHVELLNLEEIRNKASNGSRLLLEGLANVTERSIAKHLTDQDSFTKYKDDYLISFSGVDEEQAKEKSDRIITEVSEWLLGQDHAGNAKAEAFVVQVSDQDLSGAGHSLDTVIDVVTSAKLFNELRLECTAHDAGSGSPRLPANLEYLFRPMWHVGGKVISTFQCLPVWSHRSGGSLTGDRILAPDSNPEIVAELDGRVLLEAGHALRIQHELGHTQLIAAPVHYSTLNRHSFQQRYISILLAIPKEQRRLLVIELTGLPEGVPRGRLLDASMVLKEHSRARIVKIPITRMSDVSIIAESNFLAAGIDLQGKATTERNLMEKMEAFAKLAARYNLKTFVHGLHSISLTTAAVCAGYDYIDGDAIASLVETPTGLSGLNEEDLYRRLSHA